MYIYRQYSSECFIRKFLAEPTGTEENFCEEISWLIEAVCCHGRY